MTSPHPRSARLLIAIAAVGAASVVGVGVGAVVQPAVATTKPSKAAQTATQTALTAQTATQALTAQTATQTKVARTKTALPTTFPRLKVLDLATAKTIDLASLNVSAKPQLIWFWAPT